jgi:hypothetical protein
MKVYHSLLSCYFTLMAGCSITQQVGQNEKQSSAILPCAPAEDCVDPTPEQCTEHEKEFREVLAKVVGDGDLSCEQNTDCKVISTGGYCGLTRIVKASGFDHDTGYDTLLSRVKTCAANDPREMMCPGGGGPQAAKCDQETKTCIGDFNHPGYIGPPAQIGCYGMIDHIRGYVDGLSDVGKCKQDRDCMAVSKADLCGLELRFMSKNAFASHKDLYNNKMDLKHQACANAGKPECSDEEVARIPTCDLATNTCKGRLTP